MTRSASCVLGSTAGSHLRAALLIVFVFCSSSCGGGGGGSGSDVPPPSSLNLSRWPMHSIDDRFRGANAAVSADLNDDGLPDLVTSYAFDQRTVVNFHPGFGAALRRAWPAVVAFVPQPLTAQSGVHPEGVTVGDFDGDGNADVAVAQGHADPSRAGLEGSDPGVRLFWGPPASAAGNPDAWVDGGVIPATAARGHFLFVQPLDIDRDGALDIIAGGKVHGGNGLAAGLIWIEAPEDVERRRDLNAWLVHDIDPNQIGGSGCVIDDVDRDGNPDIVLANPDDDTPDFRRELVWYENPAPSFRPLRDPWPKQVIYANSELTPQPQVAVVDLDGDGRNDVLTQTAVDVLWFRKIDTSPVTWRLLRIRKDPVAQQAARALHVADLDDDGKLDLIGLSQPSNNVLPGDRAAAFWMSYAGDVPGADNWTTHVIKWGSGRTMATAGFGETWGQVDVADLDADGDLDLLANCAGWFEAGEVRPFSDVLAGSATVGLRWFENRLREPAFHSTQRDGLVVLEAEHATDALDGTWVERGNYTGFVGDGYLQNHEVLDSAPRAAASSRGVTYRFEIAAGSYYVWVRRWVPATWGQNLGAGRSDSAWLSLDGQAVGGVFDDVARLTDQWLWARTEVPATLAAGSHSLNLRVREAGYAVDRLLLVSDPSYVPAGSGPAATSD